MKRFVVGIDRSQTTLFPECLEDWIEEDNPVRVIELFAEGLDLAELKFGGVEPEITGRPLYRPSVYVDGRRMATAVFFTIYLSRSVISRTKGQRL
jgi:hypothetical protein